MDDLKQIYEEIFLICPHSAEGFSTLFGNRLLRLQWAYSLSLSG